MTNSKLTPLQEAQAFKIAKEEVTEANTVSNLLNKTSQEAIKNDIIVADDGLDEDGFPKPTPLNSAKRVPLGRTRRRLEMFKDHMVEGFSYYGFTDRGKGEVHTALSAGWDFVRNDSKQKVKVTYGVREDGQPETTYLMRLPEKFAGADKKLKRQRADKWEQAIAKGKPPGSDNEDETGVKFESNVTIKR